MTEATGGERAESTWVEGRSFLGRESGSYLGRWQRLPWEGRGYLGEGSSYLGREHKLPGERT